MTVFKTFWEVIIKYKGTILLYTILLVVFGTLNMASNDTSTVFVDSKPNILIVNNDVYEGVTKNLIDYLQNNTNIVEVEDNEEARDDALFYRDVNYIIYINEGYRDDVLNGLNPVIDIKTTGDYQASLAQMILEKYIKVQNSYLADITDENELIAAINNNLEEESKIQINSTVDTATTSRLARYFNFASYSIMAAVIFIICLVLSSFHEKTVNKRIIISSMNYRKHNQLILASSFLYSVIVWILYVVLGVILFGDALFNLRGFIYILNTFVFTFCALTIAILISTLVKNKDTVSGIVNVVALGSAFLCGAFVPTELLPDTVLNIAHVLPAYWYINSNELLASIEAINFNTLQPIFINSLVIIGFAILFIVINNIILKKKQIVG